MDSPLLWVGMISLALVLGIWVWKRIRYKPYQWTGEVLLQVQGKCGHMEYRRITSQEDWGGSTFLLAYGDRVVGMFLPGADAGFIPGFSFSSGTVKFGVVSVTGHNHTLYGKGAQVNFMEEVELFSDKSITFWFQPSPLGGAKTYTIAVESPESILGLR